MPTTTPDWQIKPGTEKFWFDSTNDGKYDTYLVYEVYKDKNDNEWQRVREQGTYPHIHRTDKNAEADFKRIVKHYKADAESAGARQGGEFDPSAQKSAGEAGGGAANIGKSDFVNPTTGEAYDRATIYNNLKDKLPGMKGAALYAQIDDMLPQFEGVAEEEKEFAEQAKKKDIYGLRKGAGKVGAQMRGAAGTGMGAGMRGAIAGQADVATGFEQAQQAYEEDIYGLEKAAEKKYEADITQWIEGMGGKAAFAENKKEGGYVDKYQLGGQVSFSNNNNNGGETFLNFLTQLPEAGGS